MDWKKKLPFLEWSDNNCLKVDWDDDGNRGYRCKDGSVIPRTDPRLAEYEVERLSKLATDVQKNQAAIEAIHDSIVNLTNDEPIPRNIQRERDRLVLWLIGKDKTYRPTIFEIKVVRPAFADRLRRLVERGLCPTTGPEEGGDGKKQSGRVCVNGRMLDLIQKEPETRGWTAEQFRKRLGCSKTAVIKSDTWKSLKMFRETQKAERAMDRRRKQKASEMRR